MSNQTFQDKPVRLVSGLSSPSPPIFPIPPFLLPAQTTYRWLHPLQSFILFYFLFFSIAFHFTFYVPLVAELYFFASVFTSEFLHLNKYLKCANAAHEAPNSPSAMTTHRWRHLLQNQKIMIVSFFFLFTQWLFISPPTSLPWQTRFSLPLNLFWIFCN